jgi:hypothetical protein
MAPSPLTASRSPNRPYSAAGSTSSRVEHSVAAAAVEAAGHRLPRAIAGRQVPPGCAGAGQPHHGFHDPAVVVGPPSRRPLGWQQGFQGSPLGVGQLGFGSGMRPTLSIPETAHPALAKPGRSTTPQEHRTARPGGNAARTEGAFQGGASTCLARGMRNLLGMLRWPPKLRPTDWTPDS